jgi:thiol-disulfide isomerase/thioredoxin
MKTIRRKTSLESLKGKYVYIDVWATWCGLVFKSTIPAKVEEQYQGKNIEFVSISVDNKIEKNGVIL